jgi:membrane protein CcdC involved in cytochrome C biogenesis
MCLLYRLVFATDPCVNLRSRIQQAPIRPFSILLPTFTVSFGRLSYAEPPSWIDAENRQELESIAGTFAHPETRVYESNI